MHELGIELTRSADGNLDLIDVLRQMAAAHMTANDAMKIFGVVGAREAAILSQNIAEVDKLTKSNEGATGTVKRMTDITNSGLVPALTIAKNAIAGLAETIGSPLLAPLKVIVNGFASLIGWVNNLAKAFPIITSVLGAVTGVMGVAAVALGGLMIVVGGAVMGVGALAKGWRLLVAVKQDGIWATLRSAAGIQAETAALERNLALKKQTAAVPLPGGGTSGPIVGGQQNLGWKSAMGAGATGIATGIAGGFAGEAAAGAVSDSEGVKNFGFLIGTTLGGVAGTALAQTIFTYLGSLGTSLGGTISGALTAAAATTVTAGAALASVAAAPLVATMAILKPKFDELQGRVNTIRQWTDQALVDLAKMRGAAGPQYGKMFTGNDKEIAAETAALRERRKAREAERDALKEVGNEYATLGKKAGEDDNRTTEEKLTAVKSKYDVESKLLESSTKQKTDALKTEQEIVKGNVTASIQSEQQRAIALQGIENQYAAQRVALAQDAYSRTMAIKQAEYEQTKALLDKQRNDPDSSADKKREAANKLIELEKVRTEGTIAAQQKLTDAVGQELDKQLAKRTEYEKKIQDLNTQAQDTQRSTQDALRSLQVGAGSEYDALKMKLSDAQTKLQEAAALMPVFPEKAMQLAKDAQTAFAALGQNIDSLQQKMRSNAQTIADAQRVVSTSGLQGAAKWQAEVQNVNMTIERARQAQAEGRTKEAEGFYKQALGQAQGVGTSGEVGKPLAQSTAQGLISTIGGELLALNQGQVDTAKAYQAEAAKGVQAAGQLQLDGIKNQMDATKALIVALTENTKALQIQQAESLKIPEGLPEAPGGQAPRTGQGAAVTQSGSNTYVSPLSGAPTLQGVYKSPEVAAITGPADIKKARFAAEERKLVEEQARLGMDKTQGAVKAGLTEDGRSEVWGIPLAGSSQGDQTRARLAAEAERAGLLKRAYKSVGLVQGEGRSMALDMLSPQGEEGATSLQKNIDKASESQASQGPQAMGEAVSRFAETVGSLDQRFAALEQSLPIMLQAANKFDQASGRPLNVTVKGGDNVSVLGWESDR